MAYRHFPWQAQCFVHVEGVEIELSWQARGVVRLPCLVEVNVAVTLGLVSCLAGPQSVFALMRLPASPLKEV